MKKNIVASMLTWVSLLASMEPWISWPHQLKLLKLGILELNTTAESDGLVSDKKGMDNEVCLNCTLNKFVDLMMDDDA